MREIHRKRSGVAHKVAITAGFLLNYESYTPSGIELMPRDMVDYE
jgi:hypothetical protein